MGVLLLLFTIGLHLRLRNVIRTEVLGVRVAQLAISAVLFTAVGLAFGLDLPAAVIIAAALGLSSTVLAAKLARIPQRARGLPRSYRHRNTDPSGYSRYHPASFQRSVHWPGLIRDLAPRRFEIVSFGAGLLK